MKDASRRFRLSLALTLWLGAVSGAASQDATPSRGLGAVRFEGIDRALADQLKPALSLTRLNKSQREKISEARLGFLLRRTEAEVRRALQPLGYYSAQIAVTTQVRDGRSEVLVRIDPGEAVRVGTLTLSIDGAAESDRAVQRALGGFRPGVGAPFRDAEYESSKRAIDRVLAERGYFDAVQERHRVRVSRADARADVDLHWRSGARYGLGQAHFEGSPLRAELLDALVPWTPGTPYTQTQLVELQRTLTGLDYFSAIRLQPQPEQARDGNVPVHVLLSPARRNVYSAGVSMGTDSGAGVRLGAERRWLNARGHKARTELDWAQRKRSFAVQYKIPAFARFAGWYTFNANVREEEFADFDTRTLEGAANRSARFGEWGVTAGLWLQRESFSVLGAPRRVSTVWYPELTAQTLRARDPINPRRGWSLNAQLRGNTGSLGSDVGFVQAHLLGKWIAPLGSDTRVLARGEFGATRSSRLTSLPPSLRFFAGGDQSIRGYGYNTLGDRSGGAAQGGKQLAVGSVELDHYFSRHWGAAAFVDAGDAFNEPRNFTPVLGAGIGLRWRSPAGPIRFDIAHGFSNPDESWRIHIRFGPDL
jgi:translocation and assembly module TamA